MRNFNDLQVGDKIYTVVGSSELSVWNIKEYDITHREHIYEPPHTISRWVSGGCGSPAKYKDVIESADEYLFILSSKNPESTNKIIIQKDDMDCTSSCGKNYSSSTRYFINKEDAVKEVIEHYEKWLNEHKAEYNRYLMAENNYNQFIKENG